jgi:RNA-binding protein YlmH
MRNRDTVLKSIGKSEDRLMMAKLLDKAEVAARSGRFTHSDFLDPHQASLAERILSSCGYGDVVFQGGYAGAERVVAVFLPDYADEDECSRYPETILSVIEVLPNDGSELTHRDYLGALMGLGIKREVTGDIIVGSGKSSLIVFNEIAEYIAGNLTKVGNTGVSLKITELADMAIPEPKAAQIRTTVSALRLDSVCAPAFGISRSKAAELIRAGKVNLNWETVQNADKQVREGDTISMKGKGRAVLEVVGAKTRKDRFTILIKKLV